MMMTRMAKVSTGRLTMGDMVDRVDEEILAKQHFKILCELVSGLSKL